ncbi:MAG: metallophosphoesterase family protein [Ignavibacteria bacterium]
MHLPWLFATRCSLLAVRYSLFATRCSLFAALLLSSCASPYLAQRQFTNVVPQGAKTIAVIGDQQRTSWLEFWKESNTEHAQVVTNAMLKKPDALLLLGDHVFWSSSKADWQFFDEIMQPVNNAGIPVFPLFGNHEYFGNHDVGLQNIQSRFAAARTTWYRWDADSVAYIMLNSNWHDIGEDSTLLQRSWFEDQLVACENDVTIRAIVVSSHHPPFTNSTVVRDDITARDEFVPLFVRTRKGQLWLSGHCHALEMFEQNGKRFIVSGGGGGPRQKLHTGVDARYQDKLSAGSVRPLHSLVLTRNGDSISVVVDSLTSTH